MDWEKLASRFAFTAAGAFVVAYAITPYLVTHHFLIPKEQNPVHAEAVIERRAVTASFYDLYTRTAVYLTYPSHGERGSSVVITATIDQKIVFRRNPSYPDDGTDPPTPPEHNALEWPIEVTLTAPPSAFTFADSEQARKYLAGKQLPISTSWAPVISSEGDTSTLILKFTNLNGTEGDSNRTSTERQLNANDQLNITANGKSYSTNDTADIPLTIMVYKNGIPLLWWQWITIAGAIFSFIFGSAAITGWLSRLLSWLTGAAEDPPSITPGNPRRRR